MSLSPELEALRIDALGIDLLHWCQHNGYVLTKRSANWWDGPCPDCGGDDRFRLNTLKKTWACRNCGVGGDSIALLQLMHKKQFVEACEILAGRKAAQVITPEELEERRKTHAAQKAQDEAANQKYRQAARERGHKTWGKATPAQAHEPLILYLNKRGIPLDALRTAEVLAAGGVKFLRQILHHDYLVETIEAGGRKKWERYHTGPAMAAAVVLADGSFGAIHQTWLDLSEDNGKLKLRHRFKVDKKTGELEALPAKKVVGIKRGGAIRLLTPPSARRMVMGEGIETTLTPLAHAFQSGTAYWCGVDLDNMVGKQLRDGGKTIWDQPDMTDLDCFLVPDWVEELVYLTDEIDDPTKHFEDKIKAGLRRQRRYREMRRQNNPALAPLVIKAANSGEADKDFNDLVMVGADD